MDCSYDCLTFDVHFIKTANETTFVLYFSSVEVEQSLPLADNLEVYV